MILTNQVNYFGKQFAPLSLTPIAVYFPKNGLEYEAPNGKIHYKAANGLVHYEAPESRLHYKARDEDDA